MSRALRYGPGLAVFLAGVAAGVISGARPRRKAFDSAASDELRRSLEELQKRLAAQESATATRFEAVEAKLDEHAGKLAEIPSTGQIVAAMEQLLSKTMASLDSRLTSQAQSIDVLKTTVSQTDNLLERVLESLDSLQTFADTPEPRGDKPQAAAFL